MSAGTAATLALSRAEDHMTTSSSRPAHFTPSPQLIPRYQRVPDTAPGTRFARAARTVDLLRAMREATGAPEGKGSLVPSAEGEIVRLLLTIPAYVVDDPWLRPVFKELVVRLPPETRLVVVTE